MYGRAARLARGDYMRSARLRGDPGLFGFLGKALGTVAGLASKILPGPAGAIAGTIGGFLGGRASRPAPRPASLQAPMPGGSMTGIQIGGPRGITVGRTVTQATEYKVDPQTGQLCPKRKGRRMNVLNPKALRRSIRRVSGYAKTTARVRKAVKSAARAVG